MKNFLKLFFVLVILILSLGFFSKSLGYDISDTGWKIDDYQVEANINEDRGVDISEKIKVDFDELQKHGIYRYIPYKYERKGNNYNVKIKVKKVTDGTGGSIDYEESKSGGNLVLKIGDLDRTITGKQTYMIDYELKRVINSFSDYDEFYWNVTGEDWPVPIEQSSINISWPEGAEMFDNTCFMGTYASSKENCDKKVKGNSVQFSTKEVLDSGEGFTVVSGIKPGLIKQYSAWTQISWFLEDNWGYLIPVVVLILLLRHYFRKGKDPKGRLTIAPEFAPPGKLRPAMMGTLLDERVDTHDISAVIIDLAVRGYLKIKEVEEKKIFGKNKDYQLTDTKKPRKDLTNYEKQIINGLFEEGSPVKLNELKHKFYKHIKAIKDDLYNNVKAENYFEENPEKVRNKYLIIGIIFIALGPMLPAFLMVMFGSYLAFLFATIGTGILFIIFAFLMPKRTPEGVELTRQIKGFKLYMHTAERYRQKFYEDKKIFEKFLPYAMVFGIVKEWANKFRDMQLERPEWYEGYGAFYPVIFATSITDMQSNMNSTLISAPSSAGAGGSGFSGGGVGGGFGGGGGGSW